MIRILPEQGFVQAPTQRGSVLKEKRELSRFRLQFPTRIQILNGGRRSVPEIQDLYTRDISSRGAFIETPDPLPEGTEIRLELFYSVPRSNSSVGTSSLIRTEGVVTRTEPEGMAITFTNKYEMIPLI